MTPLIITKLFSFWRKLRAWKNNFCTIGLQGVWHTSSRTGVILIVDSETDIIAAKLLTNVDWCVQVYNVNRMKEI